jgi:thiamine monophosphate synthase
VKERAGSGVGFGLLALLPIACCVGLPLVAAAGISVAAVAWVGGLAVGAVALVAAVFFLVVRARAKERAASFSPPPERTTR